MPECPLVTVVVPLYNGARFIEATLRSVFEQTFQRFELIVVDDGSTDGGPAIARQFVADPRMQLVEGPHLGVAAARNSGAARAADGARYLTFLDADDLLHETALETLVAALDARPDAVGAFVLAEYVDGAGQVMFPGDFPRHMRGREDLRDGRLIPRDATADVRFEHLFFSNLVYPPSCLLLRRSAFESAGGFDGRFLAEDWEFVARIARQGPIVPIDRVLAGYRRHTANASGNRARNVRGARQMWAALYHGARGAERKHLHMIWRAQQTRVARRKFTEGCASIRRGQFVPGVATLIDGAAHAVLLRPPRFWITQGQRLRERERSSASSFGSV